LIVVDDQAIRPPAARDRQSGSHAASDAAFAPDRPGAAGCPAGATRCRARCHPGRPLCDVGAGARGAGERLHHAAGDRAIGLDTKKKTVAASERDEAARAVWKDAVTARDPADFVFVDETGSHRGMTPTYARAPRGQRAHGQAPAQHGTNVTLVAALSLAGIGAAMTLTGALDGDACTAYIRELLVPSLRPGQFVIWDNVRAHQGETVRALIEAAGCRLLFLPAYSPDFNPIEEAFSKLKAFLRRAEARTRAALEAAIAAALATITAADARGWFAHCGYLPLAEQL
jgi:transposase